MSALGFAVVGSLVVARLAIVDAAVAAAGLLVAAACVVVAVAFGADARWAATAVVALAATFLRSSRRSAHIQVNDLPAGVEVQSRSRTAIEAAARVLPALLIICFVAPAVVAWFWPYALIVAACGASAFAGEYLAAAVGVRRWERSRNVIEFQQWRPRATGAEPLYAARVDDAGGIGASHAE